MEFVDLASALEELHSARVHAADAREREEQAKKYISEILDAGGVDIATAGHWEVRRELRKVIRLDQKSLKLNCPDVWEKFSVADASIFFRLRELPS